ncbi:reverse transcriptase domain-containing protein [Tanacetum coccineum]
MLIDALLHHEVEGRVDRLVEEVEELESKRAEMLDELAIKVAEEVDEQLQDLLPTIFSQIGDHVSNQGNIESQNDNAADENIHEDNRNANIGNGMNRCSYKDFVACKPKESDGKGGAVAYIRWVKKIEEIQDISDCGYNQKVKYSAGLLTGRALTCCKYEVMTRGRKAAVGMTWEDFKVLMKEEYCPSNEIQKLEMEFWNHAMVGAGHSAYTDRFHELARPVPHLVTPETKRIERYIYGLAPQILRNGSLKRSGERRGNGRESSKEGNVMGDNKRVRTGKWHFAKDYRAGPRMVNPLNAGNSTEAHRACYECSGTDHYKSACPRLNRAPGQGGNRLNQAMAIEGGQGRGNNGNLARRRAFIMGAEEAR